MSPLKISVVAAGLVALSLALPGVFHPVGADERSAGELYLPVSLNEVMVAMVNESADPIWQAAWRDPESDEAWRSVERNAYQLEIAGALLAVPGTGPLDETWTGNPLWKAFCEQLAVAAANARAAIIKRDIPAIKTAGDELVEVCEGCHIAFKPGEPTGGRYGELSPTDADFKDD